ncbi:methylmalonyl Co-A mutase-associated GTPase MeaB [Epidermidibacterium keratini]|uniref:Methylmalonyl Co-A mutase-associated GTPase MeaB n=1 Tax=Epidermidibacterium keratini TaxID=1891644 RepID=A0A7L4YIY3_9ACTN|nr:methylmalonyl Co-A mutase-associated GTPase MeaB [Epidermidibacterium keratini]QHB99290.1 methylmalonyl Co-A mutase-associated GTPase MeaB [Epidermidibacterium keratini]
MARWRDDPEAVAAAVGEGDRSALAQAITAIESTSPKHRPLARRLLDALAIPSTPTVRVGISGVPGVGKSTFIEAFGRMLTEAGHRVGVLAVDPSSVRTGGSVLGDKTRMPQLSVNPNAFVRPSPSSGTLGGVAKSTSMAMRVLEAAGYDVILVETVGVGQSETTVASMVDTFLLLGLARTGDQLQGIKKGVLEIADVVAINKADGEHERAAKEAARELSGALRMVHTGQGGWVAPVLTCSGLTGLRIDEVWKAVLGHREFLGTKGLLAKRHEQEWELTWKLVRAELEDRLAANPNVAQVRGQLRHSVYAGQTPAARAAEEILRAFDSESAD